MDDKKQMTVELSPIARLILNIVLELVDDPDMVLVEETVGTLSTIVTIFVAERDRGKVIGSRGATAEALRTIMRAAGGKLRRRYVLDLDEEV